MIPRIALACTFVFVFVALPLSAARAQSVDDVATISFPPLDLGAIQAEDQAREAAGEPMRYAIPNAVALSPAMAGVWSDLDAETRVWRLRIQCPNAVSINLGFGSYCMPAGGELWLLAADGSDRVGPYTAADNADHGELWTVLCRTNDVLLEVTVPRAVEDELALVLTSINLGYRGFGAQVGGDRAGYCEVDVICPQGDPWRAEIPAIADISINGSFACTGFMVNNTTQDLTPYFMTANHCGLTSGNAATLVVYWNFYSPTCGQHGGGSLGTHQSGSTWKASYANSDFTLVRLSQSPNPAWGITYAGWDCSGNNATSIVGIHHPNCDEKSISFSPYATAVTSWLGNNSPGDGTHYKATWLPANQNQGVTEPGSSGSPLFDQNHHVLGQLHGGYSACGASDMRDWYGRFSVSWTGGGTSTSRLKDWLDPGNTGVTSLNTLVPGAPQLQVTPTTPLDSSGYYGGPFTPGSVDYTLRNTGTSNMNYQVTKTQSWVSLTNASGVLAGGATVVVTVSINAGANTLVAGNYSDTVSFTNQTNHQGDTTRAVTLQVNWRKGDLNCDGVVNFADIDPFVLALSDPAGYQAAYPNCNILNGDCNGDGKVDFADIDPFVALLSGG